MKDQSVDQTFSVWFHKCQNRWQRFTLQVGLTFLFFGVLWVGLTSIWLQSKKKTSIWIATQLTYIFNGILLVLLDYVFVKLLLF